MASSPSEAVVCASLECPAASLETWSKRHVLWGQVCCGARAGQEFQGPGLRPGSLPGPHLSAPLGARGPGQNQLPAALSPAGRHLLGEGPQRQLATHLPWFHTAFSHSAFEEQQRLRKQEIVGRILKEEAAGETRRKRRSSPTKATGRLTLRDETWGYISDICGDRGTVALPRNLLVSQRPLSGHESPGTWLGLETLRDHLRLRSRSRNCVACPGLSSGLPAPRGPRGGDALGLPHGSSLRHARWRATRRPPGSCPFPGDGAGPRGRDPGLWWLIRHRIHLCGLHCRCGSP